MYSYNRRASIYIPKKPRIPIKTSNNPLMSARIADELKKALKNSKSIYAKPDRRDFGQHPGVSYLKPYYKEVCLKVHAHGDEKASQATQATQLEQKHEEASTITETDDDNFDDCLSQPTDHAQKNLTPIEEPKEEIKYSASMILIAKVPRVRLLVKKFTSYKKNLTEVRTLDEKIVCIEYDIFDKNSGLDSEPVQQLRVYFSIKPDNKDHLKKKRYAEDGNKVIYKEVEMIEGSIDENYSYLRDLRNIFTLENTTRNYSILDVDYLYEKAKNNPLIIQNNSGILLTEKDMAEIKSMILERASSMLIHGFKRKVIKTNSTGEDAKQSFIISRTILNEINNDEIKE